LGGANASVVYNGNYTGTFTVTATPQFTTDPGGTTAPDSTNALPASTVQPNYSTGSTVYTSNNGAWVLYGTYSGLIPPTTAGTQLNFHVGAVAPSSNAQGSANVEVVVQRTTDSVNVIDTSSPTANSDHTYYNAGETCTSYAVYMRAIIISNTSTGVATYNPNVDGYFYWYQNDASSSTSYSTTNGASASFATSTLSVAPTSPGTAVSLVITSLSTPSNAGGASGLQAVLYDPNNNQVSSQQVSATGTYSYNNAAAIAGQYTWVLYGFISTNSANSAQTYTVTAAGSVNWYQVQTTTTTTYSNNSGQAYTYSTPSSAVAPVNAGTQLTLNLTNVTVPSNAAGTTYLYVKLQNPSGTAVTFAYNASYNSTSGTDTGYQRGYAGATTFTYSAAAAPQGVWTWTVFAQVVGTNTADSAYSCSWSGTQSYYLVGPAGGNTYVLGKDGSTQRLATNDDDINFVNIVPGQYTIQVFNSATSTVGFSIALNARGL
jgi:hypothetical protein